MMRAAFGVLALCLGVALAAPVNSFDEIPAQYRELIPEDAAKILKDLTAEDKVALKAIAERHKEFNNEDEAMAALKEKSPSTHEKVNKLHQMVRDKINSLNPEAKAFAKEVVAEARKIHAAYISGNKPDLEELKAKAKEFIAKFKALPEEAKKDFEEKFPILTSVVKNPKVQEIAGKALGTVN
ncbi:unnamed protein product, partial [Mesorhabditis belari]|uniref:Fatty-acid and retinol-binding protein 1 n=1 Tax=Mesorhabditis belari TaxID=2138241 RepID=A0AAF3E9I7_9BILA